MKFNKFKIFSYIGLGLATVVAFGKVAGPAELIINVDPRVAIASTTAHYAGQALDEGGNYLWNKEVEEQNWGSINADFEKVNSSEFKSELKESECDCDNWRLVKYTGVKELD